VFPYLVWISCYYFFHYFLIQKFLVGRVLTKSGGMPSTERNTQLLRVLVLLLEVFYFPITPFCSLFRLVLFYMVYVLWYVRLDWSIIPENGRDWDDVHASFVTVAKISAYRYFEEKRETYLATKRNLFADMPTMSNLLPTNNYSDDQDQDNESLAPHRRSFLAKSYDFEYEKSPQPAIELQTRNHEPSVSLSSFEEVGLAPNGKIPCS